MEPEEYFERVVRFLETKGWNTSTTQVDRTTYVVTGTRQSETYYDRMLTMVGLDDDALTPKHLEYLYRAAQENDVDQLLATSLAGLEDRAGDLAREYDIEWIEPETIDDAFIDEFSIDDEGLLDGTGLGDGLLTGPPGTQILGLLGIYAVAAVCFGSIAVLFELVAVGSEVTATILLPGAVGLVSPLLAAVGGTVLRPPGGTGSLLAGFVGTASGYVLFTLVLGATAAGLGLVGETGLFAPPGNLVVLGALAIPVGVLGVAVPAIVGRTATSGPQ